MRGRWSTAGYDDPFHWWGPKWEPRPQFTIADLLRDGTIDVPNAALLWAALSRRRSLVVIGGPSRVGKTTLLTALLQFLPASTRRLHLRGSFESFAFLRDPDIDAANTALLINEISPHLPIYLWGPAVSQVLAAAESGFALLTTAHGFSVADFVGSLTGSPLRIPAARIAACELVALLERSEETRSGRKLGGVWRLHAERDGLLITPLSQPPRDISQEPDRLHSLPRLPSWLSPAEATTRQELLTALRDGAISNLPRHAELPAASSEGLQQPPGEW